MINMQEKQYFFEHDGWIDSHITKHFPNAEITVFHEVSPNELKVHVYLVKLDNFNILLSSGMSSLSMNVSKEIENFEEFVFAEIMLLIPKDIEFSDIYSGEHDNDYLITMLKQTAKFPHQEDTWLATGHSIVADVDFEPYGHDTDFVGGVILPSVTFSEEFTKLEKAGRTINIYSFFPLYKNEIEYKIKYGFDKLLDKIIEADAKEIVDKNRKSLI